MFADRPTLEIYQAGHLQKMHSMGLLQEPCYGANKRRDGYKLSAVETVASSIVPGRMRASQAESGRFVSSQPINNSKHGFMSDDTCKLQHRVTYVLQQTQAKQW
jgi:hypothetical protein